MNYDGPRSRPLIQMLLRVYKCLDAAGFAPRRNEAGVQCRSRLTWRPPLEITHQWTAHPGALELV